MSGLSGGGSAIWMPGCASHSRVRALRGSLNSPSKSSGGSSVASGMQGWWRPRRARAMVFLGAAGTADAPAAVLAKVAASLGVTASDLRDSLFADLPGERLVGAPGQPVSAVELALRGNLALVQRLLSHATVLRIDVEGNTRVLVRHTKWRGLICAVAEQIGQDGASLEISGPFALFRNTRLYGGALGEVMPLLAWCRRLRLQA